MQPRVRNKACYSIRGSTCGSHGIISKYRFSAERQLLETIATFAGKYPTNATGRLVGRSSSLFSLFCLGKRLRQRDVTRKVYVKLVTFLPLVGGQPGGQMGSTHGQDYSRSTLLCNATVVYTASFQTSTPPSFNGIQSHDRSMIVVVAITVGNNGYQVRRLRRCPTENQER